MKFSFAEQVDKLLIYGETQQNSTRAQALYIERYPNWMHPSHRMFQRICKKLKETESFYAKLNVEKTCVMRTTKSTCLQQ